MRRATRFSRTVWRAVWQPSLARRLVVAMLLAFSLVAVVLVASSFLGYRREVERHAALLSACRHLSESLTHAADPAQAQAVVRAAETYFNASREDFSRERRRRLDPLLFELTGRDGRRLYASAALQGVLLQSRPGEASEQVVLGRPYWGCAAPFAGGTVRLAESKLADLTVLSWIGVDLLPDLLLAFPFVLVPVWLATHQGLRPLRRLARQLGQRSRDDFSPIGLKLRHAELRPLIRSFDTVLARLRDAVQRERAFVQDAAHELRTPMAVIAAQAHVLTLAESPDQRQQAEAALDSAIARASHLSQQLLALAALDAPRAAAPQLVDVTALAEQALAQAMATAAARRLDLSLDAPEHLLASLDVGAFQSVLHNLLDNALRYVPEGSAIEVTLQSLPGGWSLRVADDGPGIPRQEHAHLFERFVRGRSATAPGTGLGLAIVRQAVQRLGGEVQLQPGLRGRGVAFEVRVVRLWLR